MNFDFSDDQKLLRDQARKFLQDKCDRKSVRSILENHKQSYNAKLWSQISELGWTCLLYTSPSPRDLSTSRMPSSA